MADLIELLRAASRGNSEAVGQLNEAAEQDLAAVVNELVTLLADESEDETMRFQAGTFCKNLFKKDLKAEQEHVTKQWLELPENVRDSLKERAFGVLNSSAKFARQGASALVARMAVLEISVGKWLNIIGMLVGCVLNEKGEVAEDFRITALECLGWICEDIMQFDTTALEEHSSDILTAVVHGMSDDDQPRAVRAAAARALYNTLAFAAPSMEKPNERDYLVDVIVGATKAPDEVVRAEAYNCLVSLADLYYEKLEEKYISLIYERTMAALTEPQEAEMVKLQAIEFWATLADAETEIQCLNEDAAELNQPPPHTLLNIVSLVFSHMAETLLGLLPVDEDNGPDDLADSDDWTIAMAAATCLKSVAACIGDDVVEHVMPFVQNNIESEEWRFREAAVMAYGSILDGPDDKIVASLKMAAADLLKKMLEDPSLCVRDTSAWAFGVLCQLHASHICQPDTLPLAIHTIGTVLGKEEHASVAASACWAIDSIAECINEGKAHSSVSLSEPFNELVDVLLDTTSRADADEAHLRVSAFEALNTLIKAAPPSTFEALRKLIPFFVNRLEELLKRQALNADEYSKQLEEQGLCCSTLQAITQKLESNITPDYANLMMGVFLALLNSARSADAVQEEALLAVGALANACDDAFDEYMVEFFPFLCGGLENTMAPMVCNVAVGVVGDCCRALRQNYAKDYLKPTMQRLVAALSVPDVNKDLTLSILSCFGDLALAVGPAFYPLVDDVMDILKVASQTSVDENQIDQVDYLYELFTAILDALVGIVNSFGEAEDSSQLPSQIEEVVEFSLLFCAHVHTTKPSDDTMRSLVGLLLDTARVVGAFDENVKTYMSNSPEIMAIVREAYDSPDGTTSDTANLCLAELGMTAQS